MSVSYGTYAFLHARLGALKADLLSHRQWEQLLSAGTPNEQQQLLQSTSYSSAVTPTRAETLRGIKSILQCTARKVERSVPPQAARFIRLWGRRDLLRNLRTILRGKALGESEEQIRAKLVDLQPAHALPTEALLHCANVEAALDLLEKTSLQHWIRAARRLYERDPTLFGLDSALDRLYYPEVWQQLGKLDSADREAIQKLVSLEIDQLNLLWLLRYRLNYHLSPAETYYLLVPVTGQITDNQLKELVQQDSLPAVVARIKNNVLRDVVSQCESIWQVEVALWRHRASVARRMLREAVFTLGEALAFLLLKVVEVRDLVAVWEGTNLGVGREEIEKQLVGVRGA